MADFLDLPLEFRRHAEIGWVASLPTREGMLEVVVHGSGPAPDRTQLDLLRPFFRHTSEIVRQAKEQLRFAGLYRLVRVSVLDGTLFLQFRNRVTGSEKAVFSYEHRE